MTTAPLHKIFIGGYTKSGTTFVGRALGILNHALARGELDYFRIFTGTMNERLQNYNDNIQVVNREVYDGFGTLEPVTRASARALHRKMFAHLYFNNRPAPSGLRLLVEKSPRNIFHLDAIRFIFPEAHIMVVYREPKAVFRSLMRHMRDHRDPAFEDPAFHRRRAMLKSFAENRWAAYHRILEAEQDSLHLVRYEHVAKDTAGFLDHVQDTVIGERLGLSAPVESLSKEAYLASLPPDARAKSLVQTETHKLRLSEAEERYILENCPQPQVRFDF
ncbi:sulfotransferase family protein [Yunchengibacter salinarum]|uniref:sulfotransferase family protein n=1 Tax=Yunchengibacter salinarum TaxID=3133399 RepID=UPI0035B580A0